MFSYREGNAKKKMSLYIKNLSLNVLFRRFREHIKRKRREIHNIRAKCFAGICKKISFCLLHSKKPHVKGSMTVEAAFVLPFFLFALVNLMSIMELYRLQGRLSAAMHNTAKDMAVYAHSIESNHTLLNAAYAAVKTEYELGQKYLDNSQITGGALGIIWLQSQFLEEDDCIDLITTYHVRPIYSLMGYQGFLMCNRTRTRAWTGYDNAKAAGSTDEEQLVYITPSGEAYHFTKSCSYLKLSIQGVDKDIVGEIRNKDGSIYYACESCGAAESNRVYVTDYGNRYHTTLQCSAIKRTIYLVPISQVGDRTPCSKCSG